MKRLQLSAVQLLGGLCLCIGLLAAQEARPAAGQAAKPLAGKVRVDGSSTVAPIMTATAELFGAQQHKVQVTVGTSGTGGGFKKFLEATPQLRTDINDASRPIKPEEQKEAARLGVEYIELPIAFDGIALVVHPSNTFCDYLTLAELRRIWEPGSRITNWKDVRAGFPDKPLKLFGPGTDSGTFDYFTEVVMGKTDACRSDFTSSENDNVLVRGVQGEPGALGYFGYSYFETNKDKLHLVAVDKGDGKPVKPSIATIRDGSYAPLARPLFIYVNREAANRAEVVGFVEFFFDNARKIVEHPKVNYVALPDELYTISRERFRAKTTGSLYPDLASHARPVVEVYAPAKK